MTITGFYHVCMVNNWKEIVLEQLNALTDSGLLTVTNGVHICALGPNENVVQLRELVKYYPKVAVVYHSLDIEEYEFPTLDMLWQHCNKLANLGKTDYAVYYLHTKGVVDERGAHWRHYMNYYNITRWRDAVAALKAGYDMSGVKWMKKNNWFPQHYSGNFFWARAEHIARKPAIDEIRHTPICDIGLRFNAEFWNGMAEPRHHSQCQLLIDHKRTPDFMPAEPPRITGN